MKPKNNEKKVLAVGKSSIFIFLPASFIAICLFFYLFQNFNVELLFIFFIFCFGNFYFSYIRYKYRKILFTHKKIYILNDKDKIFSVEFLNDFKLIFYNQTKLGKLLNYGTLTVVNQLNQTYSFQYLNNPDELYSKIEKHYLNLIKDVGENNEK